MREIGKDTMSSMATIPGEAALFSRGRNRAFVKIQDGCRHRCTFCIVTVARGDERSREMKDIITQVNTLQHQGIKEVVLTGVHVGGYGSDLGSNLYSLIQAILSDTDIERLRLASVEPWDLPDNFFALFENNRLMPHMHLPLQSGSDVVLKRMARRCKTHEFEQLINKARTTVPDFNVTTDIIVGFPGETDQEWDKSITFIEKIGFPHIHIFPYSARTGTKAADMHGHVSTETKKKRSRQLHVLQNKIKQQYLQQQIGKDYRILIETSSTIDDKKSANYFGYTNNYLRAQLTLPNETMIENKIVNAKAVSLTNDNNVLNCKIVDNK